MSGYMVSTVSDLFTNDMELILLESTHTLTSRDSSPNDTQEVYTPGVYLPVSTVSGLGEFWFENVVIRKIVNNAIIPINIPRRRICFILRTTILVLALITTS